MSSVDLFYLGLVLAAFFGFAVALAYYSHRCRTRRCRCLVLMFWFLIADGLLPSLGCDKETRLRRGAWPTLTTPASTRTRLITSR